MTNTEKVPIDVSLVRRLIATQFPQWADLPIKPIEFGGWDNRTFHLGEHMTVAYPAAQSIPRKWKKNTTGYQNLHRSCPCRSLPRWQWASQAKDIRGTGLYIGGSMAKLPQSSESPIYANSPPLWPDFWRPCSGLTPVADQWQARKASIAADRCQPTTPKLARR